MWTTWNFFFAEPPYKFQVKFIFTLTPQPPMYKCFMSPHKSLFCMETNSFRGTWNGFYTLSNKKHKDKLMDMCVLTKCKRLESSVDSLVPSTYFDCSFHKVGVKYFSFNFNILLYKFGWRFNSTCLGLKMGFNHFLRYFWCWRNMLFLLKILVLADHCCFHCIVSRVGYVYWCLSFVVSHVGCTFWCFSCVVSCSIWESACGPFAGY